MRNAPTGCWPVSLMLHAVEFDRLAVLLHHRREEQWQISSSSLTTTASRPEMVRLIVNCTTDGDTPNASAEAARQSWRLKASHFARRGHDVNM